MGADTSVRISIRQDGIDDGLGEPRRGKPDCERDNIRHADNAEGRRRPDAEPIHSRTPHGGTADAAHPADPDQHHSGRECDAAG
jgi:hypothetical protein